eukprot:TRINITY_DN10922_c0_g2_i1.p1 TRINITY_DN10922_c0_g2~~TRINITY_DN10922_c0_g2_i1.p1  ORF type:complete len:560 (+),score=90.07 TRINITY_DN10922_c0_g2_i1:86-1765(+)
MGCGASTAETSAAVPVPSPAAAAPVSAKQVRCVNPHGKSISELESAMGSGNISARSLCEFFIRRIHSLDSAGPRLRSVVEINPDALAIADRLDHDRAEGRVHGKLHGIPLLVKDNIDTAGLMRTTAGSLALMESLPRGDAEVVARLKQCGAVILGKANLSEWGNFRGERGFDGWSAVGGQCKNPHVLDRSPGGSSSGPAAAVAAGLCAGAIGTETNGSIEAPASACGVVGLKPTVGLTSRDGVVPVAPSQDSVGSLAKSVMDAAMLLDAMTGDCLAEQLTGEGGLDGVRIGVMRKPFYVKDSRCGVVCEEAVRVLTAAGATVVQVELAPAVKSRQSRQPEQGMDDELLVCSWEFRREMNRYLSSRRAHLEDDAPVAEGGLRGSGFEREECSSLEEIIQFNRQHATEEMLLFGQEHMETSVGLSETEARYRAVLASNLECSRASLEGAMDAMGLDVLLAPSGPPAAQLVHQAGGDPNADLYFGSGGHSAVAGGPLVSVPAGDWRGLPINVTFLGRRCEELQLLRVAHAYELASEARITPKFRATLDLEESFRSGPHSTVT